MVEPVVMLPAIEAAGDAPIVDLMRSALLAADPDATAAPMMITLGTDAKALATLGIPTYGFAPLQLGADDALPLALPRPRRARAGERACASACRCSTRSSPDS